MDGQTDIGAEPTFNTQIPTQGENVYKQYKSIKPSYQLVRNYGVADRDPN